MRARHVPADYLVEGVPWFRGSNVAHALGYANPHRALCHHVEEKDRAQLKDLGPLVGRGPLKQVVET